jgi:hypothetical protein
MELGSETPAAANNVMNHDLREYPQVDSSRILGVKETSNPSDDGPFGKGRNSTKGLPS